MSIPTRAELNDWASNYVELWNAGDRERWAANWRKVAPGNFTMNDPVGTPQKTGFEHCALDSFDLFQPTLRFRISDGSLFICGNEVAWLMENHFEQDGVPTVLRSIETYRFEPDGSVVIRTYYDVPQQSEGQIGELFKTYLP